MAIRDKLTGKQRSAMTLYPKSSNGNGSEKIGKLLKIGPNKIIPALAIKAGTCNNGSLLYSPRIFEIKKILEAEKDVKELSTIWEYIFAIKPIELDKKNIDMAIKTNFRGL